MAARWSSWGRCRPGEAPGPRRPSPTVPLVQRAQVVLTELAIGDPPERWADAGFTVGSDATCRLAAVTLRLLGRQAGKGIRSWTLSNVPEGTQALDGLATAPALPASEAAVELVSHPNGALRIDHLVLMTPDRARTVSALEAVGLDVRRTRDAGRTAGVATTQTFFRLGDVVLEVVAPEVAADGQSRFYGLAADVDDIDALPARYGERLGHIKDAVQPGRRIATLHHKDFGLSVAVAFMTPGAAVVS